MPKHWMEGGDGKVQPMHLQTAQQCREECLRLRTPPDACGAAQFVSDDDQPENCVLHLYDPDLSPILDFTDEPDMPFTLYVVNLTYPG